MNKADVTSTQIEISLKKKILILAPSLYTFYQWIVPHILDHIVIGFEGNGFAGPANPELVNQVNLAVIIFGIALLALLLIIRLKNIARLKQNHKKTEKFETSRYLNGALVISLIIELPIMMGLIICLLWGEFIVLDLFAAMVILFRLIIYPRNIKLNQN